MNESAEIAKKQIFNEKPDLSLANVSRYLKTRVTTLFDIPIRKSELSVWETLNPFPGLKEMTPLDYSFYFVGFFGWTIDAMDFFCVSATASDIAASLGVSITQITWGMTLVLMFRSAGAAVFGILCDYYGRKWTYIAVCVAFIAIEIATGFAKTYAQFLGIRALFGFFMGAFYPITSVNALEDQPMRARSILSGLFLPGYNLGFALAQIFYRAFEDTYKPGEGWRALFWFTSGLPVLLLCWRLCLPETKTFIKLKEQRRILKLSEQGLAGPTRLSKYFDKSILTTIKTEWVLFIYLVLLMSGFNFMSHGTQDLYPTLLKTQYGLGKNTVTVILVVVNLGAMAGGIVVGQSSELLGRRLSIMVFAILAGAFLYPGFMVNDVSTIIGGYFFLNFCVMGCWGIIPQHLLELVNSNHRSFLSGVVYQLGNLCSSASSTIESRLGENFPITTALGTSGYNYAKVMCIFCGSVFAYTTLITFLGPEKFHKDLTIHSEITSLRDVATSDSNLSKEKAVVEHVEV